jgi:hypothetical protein
MMINKEEAKANASLAALSAGGGAVRTCVSHMLTAPDEFKNINFVSQCSFFFLESTLFSAIATEITNYRD